MNKTFLRLRTNISTSHFVSKKERPGLNSTSSVPLPTRNLFTPRKAANFADPLISVRKWSWSFWFQSMPSSMPISPDTLMRNRFHTLCDLERGVKGVEGFRSQSRGAFFDVVTGVNINRSAAEMRLLLIKRSHVCGDCQRRSITVVSEQEYVD